MTSSAAATKRILIVDDHEQLLRLGQRILGEANDVAVATSAGEGRSVAQAFMPDVLIADLNLPDGNGIELALELRHQYPALRILLITGALPDQRERARLPDDAIVLLKPFAPAQLTAAVGSLTNGEASTESREAALEHRYRLLVERATDIIYETDANGFFTYANPVASAVVGLPLEKLLGIRFTQLIRKDVRRDADIFYLQQAQTRTPNTYYEFPLITSTGSEVWIGQNVQLLTHRGEITGFQAVARDITTRRNIERFKDELLAVVSHELRTPLTTIIGTLGLLKSGKLSAERAERLLTIAITDADRMRRLLQDFLDLEQIRSGQISLSREDVEIGDLFQSAEGSVHVIAEAAGVPVRIESVAGIVNVDRDRMIQALVNLLTNAIKFSAAGQEIVLAAVQNDEDTRLSVMDRGRGIPADKLKMIYEPFRQVDQADSREKGGTGIGLAITRSIVELHGGRIEVVSEVGSGSTFTICLPRNADG